MCTRPDELDLERVRRRGERTFIGDDLPHLKSPIDVTAEDRRDSVEHAALQNGERALPRFFGGLKDDEHVAHCRRLSEQRRRGDSPGRVNIMAAGVHHARYLRRKWKPGGFLDRQGVDVPAQRHNGRRSAYSADARNDAGGRDLMNVVDAKLSQRRNETIRRLRLVERQLRMLMYRAPQCDQTGVEGAGKLSLDGSR